MDESWYQWIERKIKEVENKTLWLFDYFNQYIKNVYKASTDYTKSIYNVLNTKIDSNNNNSNRNFIELFNMLKGKADKATTATKDGLNNLAQYTYSQLTKLNTAMVNNYNNSINFTSRVQTALNNRISSEIAKVYAKIVGLLPTDFANLMQFIRISKCIIEQLRKSPIDFFISILLMFFIDWIQYQIAYNFGTKEATLPSEPNWYRDICK